MDEKLIGWNLISSLEIVCKENYSVSRALEKYLKKKVWNPADRQDVLEALSKLFTQSTSTSVIVKYFCPILLDIVSRAKLNIEKTGLSSQDHKEYCVALSQCLLRPDIKRFTLGYVKGKPSFTNTSGKNEPVKKKAKRSNHAEEAICHAAWLFVYHLKDEADSIICLEDIIPHLNHPSHDVRWFACQTVIEHQKMTSKQRETFLQKYFKDGYTELKLKHRIANTTQDGTVDLCKLEHVIGQTHTNQMIVETDFCETVVCVNGILLSREGEPTDVICLDLLPVPSNEMNLHNLAVAVSSGDPVLLQGVVGSGKTSLVEHLARLTGRTGPPQLTKIQLGDQMDSKALLGTYRCTEVPGEFIWQPGVLTQAVTQGYWVLLEDIDYAPMEVVSVLLPLLESRTLSVPGHGDCIKAAPGFHLFATQRLVGGFSGLQKQQTGSSTLLDKLWTSILVEPMSRAELSQVLCKKYPKIETVIEKLLDIYFLLSAGDHQTAIDYSMETNYENVGKFLSHDGRLISTRDLMTWCGRVNGDFDVNSTDAGSLVFQEAWDCFVSCLSKNVKRLPLAEAIGAKLNLTKIKVEYFCSKYKPDVNISPKMFTVGRVSLQLKDQHVSLKARKKNTFSYTRQSSVLLEKVAVCVRNREPVLLVGETGTGKTSSVQFLAEQLGHTLHVINMNQQSDSADLLGGFKPVDVRHIIKPFYEDFELLFCDTFSQKQNRKFLGHLQDCFGKRKWDTLFSLMEHTSKSAIQKYHSDQRWKAVSKRLCQLKLQVKQTQNALAFTFMEGSLVKAIRNGDWVLLDEINLASMETLECLSGLLESTAGSVLLMERGDMQPIVRHPDFRLFACMNPATDVGKKDLSPGIRNRFTELFVDELEDPQDLKVLVHDYLQFLSLNSSHIDGIVKFYLTIRNQAITKLTDSTGHRPHYSLRTLCRALKFVSGNPCGAVQRSVYEGFCLSFLTQLDRPSRPVVEQLVCQYCLSKGDVKSILKRGLPMPMTGKYLKFEDYWIPVGKLEPTTPSGYILTPSVRANLKDLARVVSAGHHPVLIQGETSVGKTSLIKWLAESSGNVCMRVNNHEHTDLQEYVGCYAADEDGKLVFKDGVLVEAMKKGYWIILDELNLAPTDVLEALNRLLDDNRELYIPETQETVKAHDKFMLFATQNPPGHYGGRKLLSRAFRNRFIELHYDEIPSGELQTILHERCDIPLSYAKRLVSVMLELQTRRRGSGVFAGKLGFMTLRDLFRWAERYKCPEMDGLKFYDWDKHLAKQGYMLLAGRVRKPEEAGVIQEVIEKHFKSKINVDSLYTLNKDTSLTTKSVLEEVLGKSADGFQHIFWTHSMRRLAVLIGQAVKYREPVLLVGETGCGKTTICQLYAAIYKTQLHSINCHLHTESADFLGGLRPVRSHSEEDKKDKLFEWVDGPLVQAMKTGAMFLVDEISLADDSVLERLNSVLEPERTILLAEKGGGDGNLNEVEQVTAMGNFHIFGTMNPGGDFGKKELSPALRNRFTEIWCPPTNNKQDLVDIIEHNLSSGIHLCNQEDGTSGIGKAIMKFVDWFANNELGKRCTVSIRDILTWVRFINQCSTTLSDDDCMETDQIVLNKLEPAVAYIHGACLVFLDGLGAGTTSQGRDETVSEIRLTSLNYLLNQVNSLTHQTYTMKDLYLMDSTQSRKNPVTVTEKEFSIPPFSIDKGSFDSDAPLHYALEAPGTCTNAQRVLRALQLPRPLLLEGSPGVGKTSLVAAIAKATGRKLVRINLSEQTDVTDLFGADLPVEGAEGGVFAWRDGPLLQALKDGSWVVLDELNLASQSVLEGLNACLDHRAEVYVPELDKTFQIQHEKTRLFACQNPLNQGGGRKGLPRSFLNRFTQVYIEPLSETDLMFIGGTMYPSLPTDLLHYMVQFNMQIHTETVTQCLWGQRGSPWEFNLRDLFRWCDLLLDNQKKTKLNPGEYVGLIYADRMRRLEDKQHVYDLYKKIFPDSMELYEPSGQFHCGTDRVQVGHSFLPISKSGSNVGGVKDSLDITHHCLEPLESIMKCVQMNWMAILVGPQGCGKSSLVKMLSILTGNQLNTLAMNSAMDTTELLGGFEQADTNRHIEEIIESVRLIVESVSKHCLLRDNNESLDFLTNVQGLWKQFSELHQNTGDNRSTIEEHEHMIKEVEVLLNVVGKSLKMKKKLSLPKELRSELRVIQSALTTTQNKLSLAVPGAGGGAFEWIDSLLVKSLKQGHWLLIDNVNFCNASVLDRLNALLEPNGVLHINERGVIDGQIPTIKPHPNFRLFLVMDPKYGEISRAMRNRGVEIYIPGEEDGKCFGDLDLQQIVQSLGLPTQSVFTWLKSLHTSLSEEMSHGDRPTVQHLLQACRNIVSHCNLGYGLKEAIWKACYCVYVQTQRRTETKQKYETLLKEHFAGLSENIFTEHDNIMGLTPFKLPNITEYSKDPASAVIKRNSAVFIHMLENCDVGKDSDSIKLKLALAQTFHNTPFAYTSQMIDWLKYYGEKSHRTQSTELCQYVLNDLERILQPSIHLMSELTYRNILEQMGVSDSEFLGDMQWNAQLCNSLLMSADDQTKLQIDTDSNRIHIMQKLHIELALMQKFTAKLQTALEIERESGKQTIHPAISHLVVLFPELSSAVTQSVPYLEVPDYDSTVKVLNGVQWLKSLYEVAELSLTSEEAVSQLSLFWKWFNNRTLPHCVAVNSENRKLAAVVAVLQELLSKDDLIFKHFVKIWRSWGHSSPFMTETEGKDFMSVLDILKPMCLWRDCSEITDKGRVQLIVHRRQFVLETMRFLINNLGAEDMRDHIAKFQLELQTLLMQCGLLSMYNYEQQMEQDSEFTIQTAELEMQNKQITLPVEFVQLWPLFEHLSTLQSWTFLDMLSNVRVDKESLDLFCEFSGLHTPMDSAELMLYTDLGRKDVKSQRPSVQASILQRLRKCTAVHNTSNWLEWGIKTDDTEGPVGRRTVQKSFHQARLSTVLFSLLSRADNSVTLSLPCNVKLDGALEGYRKELKQLAYIVQHIWSHVSVYGSVDRDTRLMDSKSFTASLHQTLTGLTPQLKDSAVPEYTKLVNLLCDHDQGDLSQSQISRIGEIVKDDLKMTDDVVSMVTDCLNKYSGVYDSVKVDLTDVGEGWICIGLLNIRLLAPKGPIDPVEKLAVKVKLMKEELLEVNTELEVLSIHHRLLTGKELTDLSPALLHPRVPYLLDRSRELTLQIEELGKQVAYRPSPSQYKQLVTDIENYITSVASPSNVYKIVKNMRNMMKKKSKSTSAIQEVELWETSQDKFIERLQAEYPLYRDLTEPFICAVHQLVHGMHVLATSGKQKHEENTVRKVIPKELSSENLSETLENLLVTVGKFPTLCDQTPNCVAVADLLVSDTYHTLIRCILSKYSSEDTDPTPVVSDSILTSSLFHIQNEAKLRGEFTPNLLDTFNKLLETFVLSWKEEEEARRLKEELEASLYRFKEEVHGDERSEEEQLAADLKETFPQFQQDFQDLMGSVNFEDNNVRVQTDSQSTKQSTSLHISTVQMAQIHSVHTQLYTSLVSTSWYQSKSCDPVKAFDWIRPVLCSFTAATTLNGCLQDILSSRVDSRLLGTHLMVAVVQRYFVLQDERKDLPALLPEKTAYDIYHDPNVPEVIQCLPVLDNLMVRVNQLLEEWPDHPTLKQLVQIVDRIKSLPISCPVIKFLTGIELLLQKAQVAAVDKFDCLYHRHTCVKWSVYGTNINDCTRQDWESYAAKHVSMMTQLSEISHLIIQWRKLELSCWTNLLNIELHKYQSKASKWWFHLYELLHSALQPLESGDKCDVTQVTKTIKQFMEEATLGDYETRLNMLLSYHCQLAAMESRSEVTVLLNITWNLYQIYSKFSPSVHTQLDTMRSPIEKELKGFVKIARWSDINYWALKDATDKTHRILHKHIKHFQNVLRQPVQSVLADTSSSRIDGDKIKWTEQLQTYDTSLQTSIKTFKASSDDTQTEALEFRFPVLCVKVNKYWGQIMSGTQYIDHVITLDQFMGELITEVHELQALDVDRTLSKEKQKSEAKHINLRKRKALSDLYKYLAKLGLSYRKGLTMPDKKGDDSILVPPTNLSVAFKSDVHIQSVWEGCLHYYYTSVTRKAQFDTAIVTPSKELGISNIERCKGFAEHLYSLLVDQYSTVSQVSEQYRKLGLLISDSEKLLKEQTVNFCQADATKWMMLCKELLVQIGEGLNQFLVLLLCCPEKETEAGHHPSPLPVSELSKTALAKQGDEVINDTVKIVKEILEDVETVKASICPKDSDIILWSNVCNLSQVFSKMSSTEEPSINQHLQTISMHFNDPACPDHPNAFTEVLHFLSNEISVKSRNFMTWFNDLEEGQGHTDMDQCTNSEFSTKVKDCVQFILISIQKLKKAHVSKETGDSPTEDEMEDFKEGLLVKHVIEKLHSDKGMLDCGHVVNEVSDMLAYILRSSSKQNRDDMLGLYGQFLPLLKQYRNIMQYDLMSNVAAERVLGKMLSVLLNVFTDLATKGFCIPPELSDEMEGEGATEFCDIENGGLGEGEGAKNVSDQIENEDQLDDAKRPEDRKEEDSAEKPDVKSEENAIEMSEEFDGKIQDLDDADKQEDNEEDDEKKEEDDIDKQMGDVEGEDEEKLDEQMWGGDDEEEEEKEQKEETGPGDGKQSESELVAKDDKKEDPSGDDKEKDNEKDDTGDDDNKEQKPNNMDEMDQEYDDEQIDPYHEKQAEDQKAPDDLDLPDDLKLDNDEGEEAGEDTPMDTEKETDTKDEDETVLPPEESKGDEDGDDTANEDKNEDEKENDDEKEGEEKDRENEEGDSMETDETERQEEDGKDDPGFTPQDETVKETEEKEDENEADDKPQGIEHHGTTAHDTDSVEQSEAAQDMAGEAAENDEQEAEGSGQASAELEEGHKGQTASTQSNTSQGKRKQFDRQPGKSDSERSLGSDEQKYKKLKTIDTQHDSKQRKDDGNDGEADEYEHIKESTDHHDAQTLDTATKDQQEEQGQIKAENEEKDTDVDGTETMEDEDKNEDDENTEPINPADLKKAKSHKDGTGDDGTDDAAADDDDTKVDIPGDKVDTMTVARGFDSTIHTALEHFHIDNFSADLDSLRAQLETELGSWNQANLPEDRESESVASELWHRYEALTSSLSQDLCEQLRLVLEPTQATKLRGDYRTGKRLNMRKVIPYIASQFRKDKIWLRRTKPSKREYQVMLAIDDSSSMVDNHSKQIAFESLALISNALSLLEAGQLSICSFGETVNVLHPFTEQFTSQSGAHLLQYLTFEQKKTKIAQLLKKATSIMMEARQHQQTNVGNPETAQLLLIVSDGRGLFMEGMETVKAAVRQAREARVFIVFVIIDSPNNKDSILDIRVPVFKEAGQIPEIKSYMDSFPFPFYILLRDINSLPSVLSDSLRQWFELVSAVDR